jgi:hypothetical protein
MQPISKEEAIERGEKYYFTGMPCKNGHINKRTLNHTCYQCQLEKSQAFRNKNLQYHTTYNQQYYPNNKQRTKEASDKYYNKMKETNFELYKERHDNNHLAYRTRHPDRIRQRSRQFLINNRGLHNSYLAKRRTIKLQAIPKWVDHNKIREIYQDCHDINIMNKLCGGTERFVVDHIIPLQGKIVCGLHVPENLRIILASENAKKHNKFDESTLKVLT